MNVLVLLDNVEISNYSINNNGMNYFGYQSINEVFFDVFEIKHNNLELIKEKKGEFNGDPIIELDLCIENEIYKNVRFVLKKSDKITINTKLLDYTNAVVIEKLESSKKLMENTISKKVIQKPKTPAKKEIITESKHAITEQKLIEKGKEEFLESIKTDIISDLKKEITQGIIFDLLKNNIQSNFNNLLEQTDTSGKLNKLFEDTNNSFKKELIQITEKIARRESLRFAESGGGTNAVQYSNGGTMDGSLTINGDLTVHGKIHSDNQNIFVKDINGSNFVSGSYTVIHNLNTFDILLNLYYMNDIGGYELVHASLINDSLNTTQISFANQPESTDNFKLVIIHSN